MFDKKIFTTMQREMEQSDQLREKVIKISRDILKASKKAIYSLHRADTVKAKELLSEAQTTIKEVRQLCKSSPQLSYTGAFTEAQEEYAEAALYAAFIAGQKLPTPQELDLEAEEYLAGMCDLVGELVRAAINASIKEDYKLTLEIKDTVSGIYDELMMFDFRNSPLRRKFDTIKYGLEKLEDLILNLKLRGKLS